jgi:predicted nucleic acid-binding protein
MNVDDRVFVDTNVLVYTFDTTEADKRARAIERFESLVRAGKAVLSTQVLLEFYSIVTRKLASPVAPADAEEIVRELGRLPIVTTDASLVRDAIARSRRFKLSLWDGLIVSAAVTAGCGTLLSEDLQHGQVFDGVRVENPFA